MSSRIWADHLFGGLPLGLNITLCNIGDIYIHTIQNLLIKHLVSVQIQQETLQQYIIMLTNIYEDFRLKNNLRLNVE